MMKRSRFVVPLLMGLIALTVPSMARPEEARPDEPKAVPDAASAPDTWHATTFVTGRIGLRFIHYWSKGDWMRAETMVGGHPIVTIVRGPDYVSFDRMTGRGVRIRRSPQAIEADARRERPFGRDWEELVAQGAVKIEETQQAGHAVEIWRITDSAGRRKLWLTSAEPKLPMRLENFLRASGETVTTDYADWVHGIEIPDRFFDVPSDAHLEPFGYADYLTESATRRIAPVLYPDLLYGTPTP